MKLEMQMRRPESEIGWAHARGPGARRTGSALRLAGTAHGTRNAERATAFWSLVLSQGNRNLLARIFSWKSRNSSA